MSKKLLLLASSFVCVFSALKPAWAQVDYALFNLPDTVCADHEIVPFDILEGAENYNWTFCPPDLYSAPEGASTPARPNVFDTRGFITAEDEGANFTFHLNGNGDLIRYRFTDGFDNPPSLVANLGNIDGASGLFAVKGEKWHLFVLGESDSGLSQLVRFDFENGLKSMPVPTNLGTLDSSLLLSKHLYIAREGAEWYGFTFSQEEDELQRLRFGSDLLDTPTVQNLGNIEGNFNDVSGIAGIMELGNWHLFITNRDNNNINRLSFGNSLANTPFVVDLGDMNSRIKEPVGIAVTKGCQAYYAYVVNYGTASLVTLFWDNHSIALPPAATNHGNVANFAQPVSLSGFTSHEGDLYLFTPNLDSTVSAMRFGACETATANVSDQRVPEPFAFTEPGVYSVFLTVNQGLPNVQTDCKQIVITAHPEVTVSNDTLICEQDTINLSILALGPDSFRWTPAYHISTTEGQFVKVWPDYSMTYTGIAYFAENCIVKKPINVAVSKIWADAGKDRTVSDGSVTILGGAETTIGDQYRYLWTPDIHITGSVATPFTEARPAYDITYYLEVTNTDGCRAIDSVIVSVPCDNINMPNAFLPDSKNPKVNRFGLHNQQLVKVNYFKIFDRWGKLVFDTTDPQASWDGKVDGTEAPMGVYVWEVDANCANTLERFRRSGSVTLIR